MTGNIGRETRRNGGVSRSKGGPRSAGRTTGVKANKSNCWVAAVWRSMERLISLLLEVGTLTLPVVMAREGNDVRSNRERSGPLRTRPLRVATGKAAFEGVPPGLSARPEGSKPTVQSGDLA